MGVDDLIIGVDINGGDWKNGTHPSERIMKAVQKYQKFDKKSEIVLFGDFDNLPARSLDYSRTGYVNAPFYFENARRVKRNPRSVVFEPENTSLFKLLDGLNEGTIDVGVSMHDTQAMVFYSAKKIGMIDGLNVNVPPLMTMLPSKNNPVLFTDIGSTKDTKPEELAEFGLLASKYLELTKGIEPSIGILSIGSETSKGNKFVKETKDILSNMADEGLLNFDAKSPYVEGHIGLFDGYKDIVLTDGHTGNISIKLLKGIKDLIGYEFKRITRGPKNVKDYMVLASLGLAKASYKNSHFDDMLTRINPATYNGAPLLGLNNYLVKLQGNSTSSEIFEGLKRVKEYRNSDVISSMREVIKK